MTALQRIINIEGDNPQKDIKNVNIVKGEQLHADIEPRIIGILEGAIGYTPEGIIEEKTAGKGQMIFFHSGAPPRILARENCRLIVFRPGEQLSRLRECLGATREEEVSTPFPLVMKGQLYTYMEYLSACLEEGFSESHFYSVKTEGLLLLLKGYYKESELARFFGPLPMANTQFACFIYTNYNKVKTVKELAVRANLSLSSFEKEFRKVFNVPPYKWMKRKKTENIYNEICYGRKPLKVISEEYGFCSASQMNDYCKKEFGIPPGKIRESYIKKEYET